MRFIFYRIRGFPRVFRLKERASDTRRLIFSLLPMYTTETLCFTGKQLQTILLRPQVGSEHVCLRFTNYVALATSKYELMCNT